MGIHPRLARSIEDTQKKEMHRIGFSRRSCDPTLVATLAQTSEQQLAISLPNAIGEHGHGPERSNNKRGLGLVKQHRFPRGVPGVGPRVDTKVASRLRGLGNCLQKVRSSASLVLAK